MIMSIVKRLVLICLAVAVFVSCSGDDNMDSPSGRDALIVKLGNVVVYSDDEVEWRLEPNLATVTPPLYDLYMDGTRFVALMPMLDMEVNGLENQHGQPDQHFLYQTSAIVPSIKGNPMPKYTLSNFRCEVTDWNLLKVWFSCKGYDVTYIKNLNN